MKRFLYTVLILWLGYLAMNAATGIANGSVEKRTETYRVLKSTPLAPMELITIGGTADDDNKSIFPYSDWQIALFYTLVFLTVCGGVYVGQLFFNRMK